MRLIDADELFESLIFPTEQFKATFKELLDDAPTVENKGEWLKIYPEHEDWNIYECSHCGEEFNLIEGTPYDNGYNFCPNCGADMRG